MCEEQKVQYILSIIKNSNLQKLSYSLLSANYVKWYITFLLTKFLQLKSRKPYEIIYPATQLLIDKNGMHSCHYLHNNILQEIFLIHGILRNTVREEQMAHITGTGNCAYRTKLTQEGVAGSGLWKVGRSRHCGGGCNAGMRRYKFIAL